MGYLVKLNGTHIATYQLSHTFSHHMLIKYKMGDSPLWLKIVTIKALSETKKNCESIVCVVFILRA